MVAGLVVSPPGAAATPEAACTAGTASDFNGDGVRDVAIADSEAAVEGHAGAGLVRVIFGNGQGVAEVSQSLPEMRAKPEAGDRFGYSVASYDANGDGCSDLAVGTPYEDVTKDGEGLGDAGAVYVIYGSPSGFGADSVVDTYTQAGLDSSTNTEAGDLFGFSLAAGRTPAGNPFLAVGVPGEAIGELQDAGCIHYVKAGTKTTVNQDDPGIPGVAEANDRFGASLASAPRYFAVGIPGEAIGTESFAGAIAVFDHHIRDNRPKVLAGLDENHPALVSGTSEDNDRFGNALAVLSYRPEGASYESDALIAVGVPNEDVGAVYDAGAVTVLHVDPSGVVTEVGLVDRFAQDVEGEPVASDFFGQRVALANTAPGEVGTASTVKLAVSVPNQDVGAAENAGAVHVLPGLGDPGAGDRVLTRGDGLLPGAAGAREFAGMGLWGSSADLYVGIPYSKGSDAPKGVVYGVPWSAVDGGTGATTTYKPGADGIPDVGTAFGSVIR